MRAVSWKILFILAVLAATAGFALYGVFQFGLPHFDLLALIKSLGYAGIWSAVFLESGVLVFFFLPGDSLLFTAGFLASQGFLHIGILAAGCFVTAVTGNMLGYLIGLKIGLKLFAKGDTRFLKTRHLEMTRGFYARHGGKTVILARFMPIIRTFAPFLAGVGQMPWRVFMLYNLAGALVWAAGMTLMGYFLGMLMPPEQVDRYLLPIVLAIIVVSFLPSIYHLRKERKHAKGKAS